MNTIWQGRSGAAPVPGDRHPPPAPPSVPHATSLTHPVEQRTIKKQNLLNIVIHTGHTIIGSALVWTNLLCQTPDYS